EEEAHVRRAPVVSEAHEQGVERRQRDGQDGKREQERAHGTRGGRVAGWSARTARTPPEGKGPVRVGAAREGVSAGSTPEPRRSLRRVDLERGALDVPPERVGQALEQVARELGEPRARVEARARGEERHAVGALALQGRVPERARRGQLDDDLRALTVRE